MECPLEGGREGGKKRVAEGGREEESGRGREKGRRGGGREKVREGGESTRYMYLRSLNSHLTLS